MNSSGKIGVALLSFAHVHAKGYADTIQAHSDCETVVIWDEDVFRGQTEADKRNVIFNEHLDQVLANPEVEAVIINAPTANHYDLLIEAAKAGKHIFTEKSLTITASEGIEVIRVVEDAGIKFMISLPSRTRPEILFAKRVLDSGLLGDVTQMRARIAHMAALDRWFNGGSAWFGNEQLAGGGAFFDLGCHRVDIMRWFMGEPASVVSQMTNFSGNYEVDDSMVSVVTFRNKAIGILDVSWVHRHGPNPLEIYGTEGYLGIDCSPGGPKIQLISNKVTSGEIQGSVSPTNLPAALPSPMQQWISAIKDGTPTTISIYDGYNLVQLLEGCYTAARNGHEVTF